MKKTIIFIFLITTALFTFSQEISDLGITGEYYDIRSDNTGAIHILWMDGGWMKYGQIVNRQVVNQETIPVLERSEVNYRKFRPRLAVKPDGTQVHFVWVGPDSLAGNLYHCWRTSSGAWWKTTIYTANYLEYPAVTVDSAGVVHATCIWHDNRTDKHPVYYFRKPAGGSWVRGLNLAAADAKHLWCTLYTDPTGNVHATWDRDKKAVKYRYAASGGSLANSSTVTLPTSYGRNKESEIAVDSAGNVHVAAMAYNDPGQYIGYDYWLKPAGGSFLNPIRATDIDFKVENYFPNPAILGETRNMAVVSWPEPAGGYHQNTDTIRVGFYNGSTWDHMTLDTTADLKEWSRTTMANNSTTAFMVWRNGSDTLSLATFDFGGQKELTVTSPNGGESWGLGRQEYIKWNYKGLTDTLKITLWKGADLVGDVAKDIDPASGFYEWNVGEHSGGVAVTGADYTIKIKEKGTVVADTSDAVFEIATPGIVITSPNGGEKWGSGNSEYIKWDPSGLSNLLKITLWKDGRLFGTIATNIDPSAGFYDWTVGEYDGGIAPNGTGYTIKIKEAGTVVADFSDAEFEIVASGITITSPNGGEDWELNSVQNISWNETGISANLKITLWKDGFLKGTIATNLDPSAGSYAWKVGEYIGDTASEGNGYTIKIKEIGTAVSDESDAGFTISNSSNITVISPNRGENWTRGGSEDISWTYSGLSNHLKITLWKDGSLVGTIATGIVPSSGSYNWTVGSYIGGTAEAGSGYTIKIKEIGTAVSDTSDGSFSIIE